VSVPAISIERVDPWIAAAPLLREQSDHVAICEACSGAGKATCNVCTGVGHLICGDCNGQRKKYGYAANGSRRLLNCPSCRGKGEVNCPDCRRGVAMCSMCEGNGRLQRWIELEWWHRSIADVRPEWIAHQFGWDGNPPDHVITRDAEIVIDVSRPNRLAATDIGALSPQWLTELAPALRPGERVTNQRLRIARVPIETVHYRLGGDADRADFSGRRLIAPPANTHDAFARRASHLRGLRRLLYLAFLVIAMVSLARGMFYWSVPTLLSLGATMIALGAVYGSVAEWTGARRRVQHWILGAAAGALVGIAFAYAALPRLAHATGLVATGKLDAGERELHALGDAPATAWADLHLARLRLLRDAQRARDALAAIPRHLSQYAIAADITGELILREAEQHVHARRWNDAVQAILAAREVGVAESQLTAILDTMHAVAAAEVRAANDETDTRARLQRRIAAEAVFVAWERASAKWGTPPLIALRTSMARDVATLEKAARRRAR
jgi:hypothetical protein